MSLLILEELLNLSRTKILSNLDINPDPSLPGKIKHIVSELKKEKPIQYLLGKAVFYDCLIAVHPGVLIPRQETEELVHWIIQEYQEKNPVILDIGTGSGCVAIALAKNLNNCSLYATDISETALETARNNADSNGVTIHFSLHDVLEMKSIPGFPLFDIIVSNPPYIKESEKNKMSRNVLEYEPAEALFVPDDNPLIYYQAIIRVAETNIKREGCLFLEINEKMGGALRILLNKHGFSDVVIRKDIHEKERMVKASWPGKKT